jgi:hypothetical protein
MDSRHAGDIEGVDIESARLAQAGVKAAVNNDTLAQETIYGPPSYDSSTPLLGTPMPNGDGGESSQQRAASGSESAPPPPNALRNAFILLTILFLPFIMIMGSWVTLVALDIDPLGFSFLAFLLLVSLVLSALVIALLVRSSTSYMFEASFS